MLYELHAKSWSENTIGEQTEGPWRVVGTFPKKYPQYGWSKGGCEGGDWTRIVAVTP